MPRPWVLLREALWERCGGYCESPACGGVPLGAGKWDAHHRLMRSHGGLDELPNLVALHPRCHTQGTRAVHDNVGWAVDRGLIVLGGRDPAVVPVVLPDGRESLLLPDGRYSTRPINPFR